MRLTKAALSKLSLPAGKTEMLVFDDALPGFGLRVRAGGKRTWIAQYRFGEKQRRITLGSTETLDPDEARRHAREALAKVSLGADPQGAKTQAKAQAMLTFGATIPGFLAYADARMGDRHHTATESYLRKHWSSLSELGLRSITRGDVAARLGEIATERGKFAANRARAALSSFFGWAIGEGLTDVNPVEGTHRPAEEVARDRVLTDDELGLVWRRAGSGDFGTIVRLLILTAARREEVGGLMWAELDGDIVHIGAARSKNGRPHDLPLSGTAAAILAGVPRRADRQLIFGTGAGSFQGWSKGKTALDARILAELKKKHGVKTKLTPWRLHDLRRTAATRMADLGVLPHVVEAVLGHVSGFRAGVAGIYNRAAYLPEKRAALELWADRVAQIVGGSA